MTDHTWILENIETYLADGLESAERDRFDRHVAECPACARSLAQARELDRKMENLFAGARPRPALEDRMIQALRAPARRNPWRFSFYPRLALTAAAVLLLAFLGGFLSQMAEQGGLAFPGAPSEEVSQSETPDAASQAARVHASHNLRPLQDAADCYKDKCYTLPDDSKSMAAAVTYFKNYPSKSTRVEGYSIPGYSLSDNSKSMADAGTNVPGWKPVFESAYKDTAYPQRKTEGDGRNTNDVLVTRTEEVGVPGSVKADEQVSQGKPTSAKRGERQNDVISTATESAAGRPGAFKITENVGQDPEKNKREHRSVGGGLLGGRGQGKGEGQGQGQGQGKAQSKVMDIPEKNYYSYRDERPGNVNKPHPSGIIILADGEKNESGTAGGRSNVSSDGVKKESGTAVEIRNRYLPGPGGVKPFTSGTTSKPAEQLAGASEKAQADQKRLKSAPETQPKPDPKNIDNVAQGDDKEAEKPVEKPQPVVVQRKVIRSGEIEFEVVSFDSAVAAVTKLVGDIKEGGFIATINSEKLANGKMKGAVVVRVPPDRLDGLVLDLRRELGKDGELKGQRIGSQDISKQYTDLESRLRAARSMEERLLRIIKEGKGEIKDLLQAEKELGTWRTRIEEIEGELRYYANLVALSTLTIKLQEKEIRSPYGVVETERVQMGIEVEDVEKAQQETLAAVAQAKGRVTKSELKQSGPGQYSAVVNFEVAPDAAGPLRDRLKQLGQVARLEVDRLQESEGGTGRPRDAKTTRNDTCFFVSLYNLMNVAPRETVHVNLACMDAESAYKTILARVDKSAGRVVASNLNRQKSEQTTGAIQFEVKTPEADAVLADLKALGEVMRLDVTENPDTQNATRSKRGFHVQLFSLAQVAPRETSTIQLAAQDVPAGYRSLQEAVAKAKGRILNARFNEQDKHNIGAQLDFEVRRTEEPAVATALAAAGAVLSRNVDRAQDSENVIDSKMCYKVTLVNLTQVAPRETVALGVEVMSVDQAATDFATLVHEKKGRTLESRVEHEPSGQESARLVFEVPLASASALVEKMRSAGTVRAQQASRNPQVPDNELATARLFIDLKNVKHIVPRDEGPGQQFRSGLHYSFVVLSWSLMLVIVGLSAVLPWVLILAFIYSIYRLIARKRRQASPTPPAA